MYRVARCYVGQFFIFFYLLLVLISKTRLGFRKGFERGWEEVGGNVSSSRFVETFSSLWQR